MTASLAPIVLAMAVTVGAPARPVAAQEPTVPPVMPPAAPAKPAPGKPAPGKAASGKAEAKPPPSPPVTVTMTPRVWKLATYSFEGRVETGVTDMSVEAPPAYQESFAFWTGRMKGSSRSELIQHLTTTREPAADGSLPFRRQVSRFLMDINDHGQVKAGGGPFMKDVLKLGWEGTLDPRGNVTAINRIGGPEDTEALNRLAFGLLDHLFPRLDAPREIRTGESFVEERTIPLPSKLAIVGLEAMAIRMTRRYTVREVRDREVILDVAVIYAADPDTPPTAPRTTCMITGGGVGEATFDLEEGIFIRARQPTSLIIDIEAPLRRLPDQPQDVDPGTAKTHMELKLDLSGKQTVARLFHESAGPESAEPESVADPEPAPNPAAATD